MNTIKRNFLHVYIFQQEIKHYVKVNEGKHKPNKIATKKLPNVNL